MQTIIKIVPIIAALLVSPAGPAAGGEARPPPGTYGGARQQMVLTGDGAVHYHDTLGLDSITITAAGGLEATFPAADGSNVTLLLQPAPREQERAVWTAHREGRLYKATAIPHAEELYSFRLEVLCDGHLIGGAQVFCAICRPKR